MTDPQFRGTCAGNPLDEFCFEISSVGFGEETVNVEKRGTLELIVLLELLQRSLEGLIT